MLERVRAKNTRPLNIFDNSWWQRKGFALVSSLLEFSSEAVLILINITVLKNYSLTAYNYYLRLITC